MYGEIITVGIIVSLVFSTLTELSPAGLIVPGYLALNLSSPYKLLWTAVTVFITLGIYKLISRFTILYGKRRFAVMVIISLCVGWVITALPVPAANIGVVGYLIPAIIAKECERQGILKTLIPMCIATAITAGIVLLLGGSL